MKLFSLTLALALAVMISLQGCVSSPPSPGVKLDKSATKYGLDDTNVAYLNAGHLQYQQWVDVFALRAVMIEGSDADQYFESKQDDLVRKYTNIENYDEFRQPEIHPLFANELKSRIYRLAQDIDNTLFIVSGEITSGKYDFEAEEYPLYDVGLSPMLGFYKGTSVSIVGENPSRFRISGNSFERISLEPSQAEDLKHLFSGKRVQFALIGELSEVNMVGLIGGGDFDEAIFNSMCVVFSARAGLYSMPLNTEINKNLVSQTTACHRAKLFFTHGRRFMGLVEPDLWVSTKDIDS